jgi:hypothetical protein
MGLFQEERWCPPLTTVSELALLLWPQPFFAGPHGDLNPRAKAEFAEDVLDVLLNRPLGDDQDLGDLATRFALGDQGRHFALALSEAAEGSFGGMARREWLLMRKQRCGLLQEMSAKSGVWNGGGEVLDQFLGEGLGMLRLLVTPLGLIQIPEVDGNAPQQRS